MKITLIPKTYTASVNLDGGAYNGNPGGNYTELTGSGWSVNHTWSQDTPLINPTGSSGRTFTGWKLTDANGRDVTSQYLTTNSDGSYSLNAGLKENVTLTALWSGGSGNGGNNGGGNNGGGNNGGGGNGGGGTTTDKYPVHVESSGEGKRHSAVRLCSCRLLF